MNPYRDAPSPLTGPRWGVTPWKKSYVRFARIFFDIRKPYRYQREYNQYLRDKADYDKKWSIWPRTYERWRYVVRNRPPMPLPPPIYINE